MSESAVDTLTELALCSSLPISQESHAPTGFFTCAFLSKEPTQGSECTSPGLTAAVFVKFLQWEAAPTIRYGALTRNPFT